MADRVVEVLLRANVSQYRAAMLSAGAATESAMAQASRATSRHEAAFKAAGAVMKVGALGIAGGLAVATAASADFEARMANVKVLAKASSTEMVALRAAAMHAGTGYGYTANQVADAEAEMVKAGVSLRDIMGGGLKGTLALAAAGQMNVADATQIAASAMTQFRLKGAALPHVADLLAAGADKALGSVQDLGTGLEQSGTTAHQMGLSIEQTTGTLTAFAQAGLIGERGGTTFKQMLLRLSAPSKQAADLMHKYNLSLYDANGQIKTMPQLAGNLQRSFEHLTPAQRNSALATIFGSRAIQGANIMMADGQKGMSAWIKKVNDQGFAAHQASGKLNSLKGDWEKLKAAGENALIDLGSGSQAPLRGLVQSVTHDINTITKNGDLQRWSREIGHDLQQLMTDAGPLAHSVGGALELVGTGIHKVVDGFNSLPKGVQTALVTGGAVAAAGHKLGVGSLLDTLVGGGLSSKSPGGVATAASAVMGRAGGVVPVFVTNSGFASAIAPKAAAGAAAVDAVAVEEEVTRVRRRIGSQTVTAAASAVKVAPVAVTNWPVGFGGTGPVGTAARGGGAAAEAEAAAAAAAAARVGIGSKALGLADRGLRSNLGLATLEVGALAVHNVVPGRAGATATGALVGAGIGGRIAGVPGAGLGALVGGGIGFSKSYLSNKPATAFDKEMAKPTSQVQKLEHEYKGLYDAQEKIRKADPKKFQEALDVPGPVRTNADKMNAILQRMHQITGDSTATLKAQALAVANTGHAAQKSYYDFQGLSDQTAKVGISAGQTAKMMNSLPAFVQMKIATPGALTSKKQIVDLAHQFKLTPRQVRTIMTLVGARDATSYTKTIRDGLKSLPKDVQTKIHTEGGVTSMKQIADLARAYHLTPKQVATLIKVLDATKAKAQIDNVQKGATKLNQTTARPHVEPQGTEAAEAKFKNNIATLRALNGQSAHPHVVVDSNAGAVVSSVRGMLSGINGDTAHTYIITTHRDVRVGGGSGVSANPTVNAAGGFYAHGVKRFADGGVNLTTGASVARVPQLRQGGGTVMWNEAGEVPWEAYISGKPGMRGRNQKILALAANRLGGVTHFANGGSHGLTAGERKERTKEIKAVTKALANLSGDLKKARESSKQYKASVAQAFTTDPFGGTIGGFDNQMAYETKRLGATKANLATLHSRGLSGALFRDLAASGNSTLIGQFAHLSKSQLAAEQKKYSTERGLVTQVSAAATSDVYGKKLAELSHEVGGLTKELHALRHGGHVGNKVTNIARAIVKDSEAKTKARAAATRSRHL